MVDLKQGRGRVNLNADKTGKLNRNLRMKTGVTASFQLGLNNPLANCSLEASTTTAESVFQSVLMSAGFIDGVSTEDNPHHPSTDHWKVTMSPRSGYEVTLLLGKDQNVKSLKERELSWVHCTVLQGREHPKTPPCGSLLAQHDVRLHIQTKETVEPNGDLYRFVFPEDLGGRPPIVVKGDGHPYFHNNIPPNLRRAINIVKHSNKVQMFSKDGINASIITGVTYLGEDLALSDHYCHLSFYFSCDEPVRTLKQSCSPTDVY